MELTTDITLFLIITLVFVMIGVMIFLLILWIAMIIDCAKRKFKQDSEKIVWILVVILASWVGALIYYFVVFRKDARFKKGK